MIEKLRSLINIAVKDTFALLENGGKVRGEGYVEFKMIKFDDLYKSNV